MSDSQKDENQDQKYPLRIKSLYGLSMSQGRSEGSGLRFGPNVANSTPRRPRFTPKVPDEKRKSRLIKSEPRDDKEGDNLATLMNLEVSNSDKVNRRQACDRAGLNAVHSSVKRRDNVIMGGGLRSKSSNFAKSNKDREDHKETLENYFFQTEQDSNIYAPAILPFHRVSRELKERTKADALEREGKNPMLAKKESKVEEGMMVDADDERSVSTLFLTDDNTTKEDHLMLLQLPADLPLKENIPKGEEDQDQADGEEMEVDLQKRKKLLPNSQLGKLIFYKSGKVKMKIGDSLFDVKEGMDCQFYQEVVAVSKENRTACFIDQLNKKLVASPNIEDLVS